MYTCESCDISCDFVTFPWSSLTAVQPALSRSGFLRTSCKAWQCSVVSELLDTNSLCTAGDHGVQIARALQNLSVSKPAQKFFRNLFRISLMFTVSWGCCGCKNKHSCAKYIQISGFFSGTRMACSTLRLLFSFWKHHEALKHPANVLCSGWMFELLGWVRVPACVEVHEFLITTNQSDCTYRLSSWIMTVSRRKLD